MDGKLTDSPVLHAIKRRPAARHLLALACPLGRRFVGDIELMGDPFDTWAAEAVRGLR